MSDERLKFEPEVTTSVAASYMGMSRMHMIGLLEAGTIPFHLVGTHRRIYEKDLIAYKKTRDTQRAKAIDELARAEYDDGLYDLGTEAVSAGDPAKESQ